MESGSGSHGHVPARRARFEREESELEFTRIVAFSDGVFAIAITLLVLSLQIPAGLSDFPKALRDQGSDFFAFALSFAVLTRIWLFHHRLFGALARFDSGLIRLNFLYLAFVTLVPFSAAVIGDYGNESAAAVVYAVNLAALGATGALATIYAFRHDLIRADRAEALEIDMGPANWAVAAVFVASIPLALISASAAEWSWLVFFAFSSVILRALRGRPAAGSVD